jgi:hypothetical protein
MVQTVKRKMAIEKLKINYSAQKLNLYPTTVRTMDSH